MKTKPRYRLAIDLGMASIGWCIFRLNAADEPSALIRAGVRIFPTGRDPQDGSSLAVTRRLARQMRRRRDRLLKRKARLLVALVDRGLLPDDDSSRRATAGLNPYELRARGLDHALMPHELGRALFHLNQRRGFRSNRRTDAKDNESGLIKASIRQLHATMEKSGARTVGEWLAWRHRRRESVRARLRGTTAKDRSYDLYIDRATVEAEFNTLWSSQSRFHPQLLTPEAKAQIHHILFHQRPLRPVRPGRCTLIPDLERAPQALPSSQHFRIYQELHNLRILGSSLDERPLSKSERDCAFALLNRKTKATFTQIARAIGLAGQTRFNLQDEKRDALTGNATAAALARGECLGDKWFDLSDAKQDALVERLLSEENEHLLVDWLQAEFGVNEAQAERMANLRLPDGHSRLSREAISRVNAVFEREVCTFDKAVIQAGLGSHSELAHSQRTGEIMTQLPYYGEALARHVGFGSGDPSDPAEKRYGRIANPTVHIGLNQVRLVVNGLIRRYGPPSQVVLEVARDLKQGERKRREVLQEQSKRQKENDRWVAELSGPGGLGFQTVSALDLQKMRLWTELNPADPADRRCPYTGEPIGLRRLFSEEVEIEHILPFSRTLDDSLNNKTVALRRANRDKGNRTPYEAFGSAAHNGYDYAAILERAKAMPREKAKRFAPDGYQRWLREDKDFLARALNDTAYLSRVAKEYLTLICPFSSVWVIPGRLTAMLRARFGLNDVLGVTGEKNRDDHRHHAVDAAVVGITDRRTLQLVSATSASAREQDLPRLLSTMPPPWPTYRDHVQRAVEAITVSHKPDHNHEGQLHNDTAYGLAGC